MKLHLPSGLRKALLACIAAIAAHSALPVTVSAGALATSGALVSFILSQQAVAEEVDDEEDDEIMPLAAWIDPSGYPESPNEIISESGVTKDLSTDFGGDNIYLQTSVSGNNQASGNNALITLNNGAGKALKLERTAAGNQTRLAGSVAAEEVWLTSSQTSNCGYFRTTSAFLTDNVESLYISGAGLFVESAMTNLSADIHIGATYGSGLVTQNFDNIALWVGANLATTGTLYIDEAARVGVNITYFKADSLNASADLTLWTKADCALQLTNGGSSTGKLVFVSGMGATGANNIKFNGELSFSGIAGGDSERQGNISLLETGSAGTLIITGHDDSANSASYITISTALKLAANASQTFVNSTINGAVSLLSGSSLTLSGTSAYSGSLEMNTASLTVSGDITLSALNLTGGKSTLNLGDGNHILELTAAVSSGDGSLVINLADWISSAGENDEYALFSYADESAFDSAWWDFISVDDTGLGEELGIEYLANGSIRIVSTAERSEFEWTQGGSMTWGKNDWNNSNDYANDGEEKVSFNSNDATTITLTGEDEVIRAHDMSVNGVSCTFAGDDHSLEIYNLKLDADSSSPGATVRFEVDASVTGSMMGGGDIVVSNNAKLTISGNNSQVGSLDITLSGGGSLELMSELTLQELAVGSGSEENATVTLGANLTLTTLTLNNNSSITFSRSEEDDVWVDFAIAGSSTINDIEKLTFDGVGFRKSGVGTYTVQMDGVTELAMPISVTAGTLMLDGGRNQEIEVNGNVTISGGSLTLDPGAGEEFATYVFNNELVVEEGATLQTNRDVLVLTKGGTVNGSLEIDWNGSVKLGADLILGASGRVVRGVYEAPTVGLADDVQEAYILFSSTEGWGNASYGGFREINWNDLSAKFGGFINSEVGFGLTNSAELGINIQGANITIGSNIKIDSGSSLAFTRAGSATVQGKITGEGTLVVSTEVGNGNGYLTVEQGGSIGTLSYATSWGGGLNIEDDFTVGFITTGSSLNNGRQNVIKGSKAEGTAVLTVTGNSTTTANKVTIEDSVKLALKTGARLNFDNSTINSAIEIADGSVLKADRSTFGTGAISLGSGSLLYLYASTVAGEITGTGGVLMSVGNVTLTADTEVGTIYSASWTGNGDDTLTISGASLAFTNISAANDSFTPVGNADTLNLHITNGGSLMLNATNWENVTGSAVTLAISGTETEAGTTGGTVVFDSGSSLWELSENEKMNITAANLTFKKMGSSKLSITHSMAALGWAGLNVAEGTLRIKDAGERISIASLTLGATLELGSGVSLSLDSLTLSEDATLGITGMNVFAAGAGNALIHFNNDATIVGSSLALSLDSWEGLADLLTGDEVVFALFSGLDAYEFDITGLENWSGKTGWHVAFDEENGNLVFHYEPANIMYWANDANGTWEASGNTTNWANEDNHAGEFAYNPGYEAVFGANGTPKTVTVSGSVAAKAMTVEATYTFNAHETEGGEINVDGALRITNTGTTLTLGTAMTAGSVETVGMITLSDGGSLTVKGAFNATQKGMAVMVNGGATLTLEQGGTIADQLVVNMGSKVIIGGDLTSTAGLRGSGGSITATKDGTSVILARQDNEEPNIAYNALTIGDETHSVGLVLKEQTKQKISEATLNIHGDITLMGTSRLRHTGPESALQMVGDVVFEGTGEGSTNPWIWLESRGVSNIDGALTRGGDLGDGRGILYIGNGHQLTITGGGSVYGLYFSSGNNMELNLGADLEVDIFHYDNGADNGADNVALNNTDPTGDDITVTITKTEQLSNDKTITFGEGVNATFKDALDLGSSTMNVGGRLETEKRLTLNGATVSVGNGGTISELAGSGSLTVSGGTLAVTETAEGGVTLTNLTLGGALRLGSHNGGNRLTVNTLTLNADAALAITDLDQDAALISLASDLSIAGNGSLKIDLSGWTDLENLLRNSGEETELRYALFTGLNDYSDLAAKLEGLGNGFLREGRGSWAVELGENGELVFTLKEAGKLYWTGNEGTWSADDPRWSGSSSGDPDLPFSADCTIVFGEGNADTVKDVTVIGNIVVGFMEVSDTYSFTVNEGEGSLTVDNGLNIDYEKSVTFLGDGVVSIHAVTGGGTLVVDAENGKGVTVSLGEDARESFNGNVTLNSGTLTLANGLILGGDQEHDDTGALTLAGGTLAVEQGDVAAMKIEVAGAVVIGGANTEATLAAESITGNGELANETGHDNTLDGNAAEFSGSITAAEDSTWTLTGDLGGAAEMGVSLMGAGTVIVQYDNVAAEGLVITGEQTGQGGTSIENAMGADTKLILANAPQIAKMSAAGTQADERNMESGALIFNNNAIQLGTETRPNERSRGGVWGGDTLVGAGDFILVNGTLLKALTNIADGVSVSVNAHGNVNAGGTASSLLGDIVIHGEEGGRLENVSGGITAGEGGSRVLLSFGKENISSTAGTGDYLIRRSGDLTVKSLDENDGLAIDLSNEGLVSILENHRRSDYKSALHIVSDGTLNAENLDWTQLLAKTGSDTWTLLNDLGFNIVGAEGGDLVLAGTSKNVYLALNEWEQDPGNPDAKGRAHEVEGNGVLSKYDATVVDRGVTLTLTAGEEELTVNNLVGLKDSTLHGKRSANVEDEVTIVLNNKAITGAIDKPGIDHADGMNPDNVRGENTHFEGSIIGDEGVNYAKDGKGTLHVGAENGAGGLQLEGDLALRDGGIVLKGSEKSRVRDLVFAYGEDAEEESGMEVTAGVTLTVNGSIAETDGKGGDLRLTQGGSLILAGESELGDTRITGDSGSLTVNGALRLRDGASVTGGSSIAVNGTLDLGNSAGNSAGSLTGSGKLLGGNGSELTIYGESSFDGMLDGSATGSATGRKSGGGTLYVSGALDLTGVKTTDYVWNANVQKNASLTVDVTENNKDVQLNVTLNEGAELNYYFNSDDGHEARLRGDLAVTGQAALNIDITGEYTPSKDIALGLTLTEGELKNLDLSLTGKVGQFLDGGLIRNSDGSLSVQVQKANDNKLHHAGMEKNAKAGADLMWAAAEYAWENPETNLGEFWSNLSLVKMMGGNVDRPLAALAGASTSVLGNAISQDIERQLKSIRNRTTMMTDSRVNADAGEPEYHAWISAESGYHKLDADGMAPGFTLNGWGGTVGMDVQMQNNVSVGLALTAMYNDLKTESADNGRGDIDTTYLSAFARVANGAWTHTFVVSAGMAEVTLNRRVSVGGYGHEAHGSTDGYALGALYEVGYTYLMNEEGTFALQPVANLEVRHSSLKGYTESGAGNAGLRVDDISHNVVTVGAGVRMQTVLGENAFNRSSVFEARALVKADLGDSSGSATTALLYGGRSAEVESASVGRVGIELGAGVSVPVGSQSGSIFADGSVELRAGYSSMNASAGYRVSF